MFSIAFAQMYLENQLEKKKKNSAKKLSLLLKKNTLESFRFAYKIDLDCFFFHI